MKLLSVRTYNTNWNNGSNKQTPCRSPGENSPTHQHICNCPCMCVCIIQLYGRHCRQATLHPQNAKAAKPTNQLKKKSDHIRKSLSSSHFLWTPQGSQVMAVFAVWTIALGTALSNEHDERKETESAMTNSIYCKLFCQPHRIPSNHQIK